MGLTVHYGFSHTGDRDSLLMRMSVLRRTFEQFPVDVRDLLSYEPGELENESGYGLGPEDGQERWFYARSACTTLTGSIDTERKSLGQTPMGERVKVIREPSPEEVAESWEAFVLPVYIMEGCEPFVVTIGKDRDSEEWSGRGFTKTQYAKNFLRAHLLVISMLDLCDQSGILEGVSDEGNYWETRDLSALTDEEDNHREAVDAVGTMFEKAAEELEDIEMKGEATDSGQREADDLPSFE